MVAVYKRLHSITHYYVLILGVKFITIYLSGVLKSIKIFILLNEIISLLIFSDLLCFFVKGACTQIIDSCWDHLNKVLCHSHTLRTRCKINYS